MRDLSKLASLNRLPKFASLVLLGFQSWNKTADIIAQLENNREQSIGRMFRVGKKFIIGIFAPAACVKLCWCGKIVATLQCLCYVLRCYLNRFFCCCCYFSTKVTTLSRAALMERWECGGGWNTKEKIGTLLLFDPIQNVVKVDCCGLACDTVGDNM